MQKIPALISSLSLPEGPLRFCGFEESVSVCVAMVTVERRGVGDEDGKEETEEE